MISSPIILFTATKRRILIHLKKTIMMSWWMFIMLHYYYCCTVVNKSIKIFFFYHWYMTYDSSHFFSLFHVELRREIRGWDKKKERNNCRFPIVFIYIITFFNFLNKYQQQKNVLQKILVLKSDNPTFSKRITMILIIVFLFLLSFINVRFLPKHNNERA